MATRCPVCGLLTEPDDSASRVCVAKHPLGVCCHAGDWLIADDGGRFRAVAWPDCVFVDRAPRVVQLGNEHSREAGVCSCDSECSVRLVERAGATDTVLRCLTCGDTRVIHSQIPR